MIGLVTGVPAEQQVLNCCGRQLRAGPLLPQVPAGSTVSLLCRLRGGAATANITLQPRVQKDKWSLYWKESMATKSEALDSVAVNADVDTKLCEVLQVATCNFVLVTELLSHHGQTILLVDLLLASPLLAVCFTA